MAANAPKMDMDVLYIIDATKSMRPVIEAVQCKIQNVSFQLLAGSKEQFSFRYGAICYRDLVSGSNHEYPLYDFDSDVEQLSLFLNEVEGKGGRDFPEDWAGALEMAFSKLSWKPNAVRTIIWITDSPAHGKKYCGQDNYNEETERLDRLTVQLAKDHYHFIGISIEGHADLTYKEMKKIYDANNGPYFFYETLTPQDRGEEIGLSLGKSATLIADNVIAPLLKNLK